MRFTRLRLSGFKSFVDPTELVIAPGLTGVVGPNGCGKSNLLEALRWVMGESRPTAMRGGGMEDVIFAGAATRPARHHAEVTLVIDNTDRLAPAAFNDADTLDVVRRITRDAGSAYRVGAKEARARDVQMLFADASTGAHSQALVRQGQIAELINAKPAQRRRILEEAAGISGLYQRRHEAELKLRQAEGNLARLDDTVGALASQLASLARQARAAARYREIGAALRRAEALLLWRRWHEAGIALAEAEALLREQAAETSRAEGAARAALSARTEAETALPPLREEDAVATALLARLETEEGTLDERARRAEGTIRAVTGRLDQITRDRAREEALTRDADEVMTRLRAEGETLRAAGEGHEARLAEAQEQAVEAARNLEAREAELSEGTEEVARLSARHQSGQRLVQDAAKTLAREEAAAEKAREAARAAQDAATGAEAAMAQAGTRQEEAQEALAQAETALEAAEAARAQTQGEEAEARSARSAAEGEASALKAEAAALSRLVEREAGAGTQLLDRLEVHAGYEAALGAALGEDLQAPEIAGEGAFGWDALPDYEAPQPLPGGARVLGQVVNAPPVLARRLAQIGVVSPEEGARLQALLQPGQRLVSEAGDLWRWDGYRASAGDAPSAAALRLQQLNKLAALKDDVTRAEAQADQARSAHETLSQRLKQQAEADASARRARREADAAVAEAARALSRAESDLTLAQGRLETAQLAEARHAEEARAARTARAEAEAALAELPDLGAAREAVEGLRRTVEAARIETMSRRSAEGELRREGEARTAREAAIAQELAGWDKRLSGASGRIEELTEREVSARRDLDRAQRVPGEIAEQREGLGQRLAEAKARRGAGAEALAGAEARLRDALEAEREAERQAGAAREARARAEARADAARSAVEEAAQRSDEALEMAPEAILAAFEAEEAEVPAIPALETEAAGLRRQRDALGSVNLRAEEDAQEIAGEHETLIREKADLENAIATLRQGIASLNSEGRQRLLDAFEEVNANFSRLFTHLFGGGEARLELVESADPLEAGLELLCQPPGKKLQVLSLLSGGEQTLTALALIFAVFLANPAPICVLDEVDAPLDDANVTRFCDLLDEMTRSADTRFLIITHHAVTMSRMDRLFGVTMGEQGVSQLVSVDLKKAEALVA
ncbi:chromosome segregation protein SMC [Pseudoroseicyclus aestuarii]|nr:chromosome segregation protein SMC [Pseudoroseicyclus aestuarii]